MQEKPIPMCCWWFSGAIMPTTRMDRRHATCNFWKESMQTPSTNMQDQLAFFFSVLPV
jgi:hypothetical protein